ncbi:acyltransferase family protein [Pseudomonas sp. WS 5027]|uniref:acyltransferase family protein n=1 Tax=unclassified Pseudomonas TaxID=196821 RepID=UPI001472D0EE|nr:acyltransferase [Pseudomonas sp. WS 5086]NMY44839.1 acyltransferase [Pseudomonas sp. WS 5027]
MSPLSPRCITYFDCLRFLLAQTVVVGHGFGFFFGYWGGFFPSKAPYIQSIAVVGFFFVSGFLICRSAVANIKYKGGDYVRYYVDRLSRVYTTLAPCLIFVFLVDLFFSYQVSDFELGNNLTISTFFKNLLLLPSMPFGTMRPIWSLMFEWWIYILFGGVVFFRKNWIFSAICIGVGGYYTFKVNAKGEAGHLEVIWMAGAIASVIFESIGRYAYSRYAAWVSLSFATVIYLLTRDAYNIFAGLLFSCGLLFIAISFNCNNAIISSKVSWCFNRLAGYSFTLFLTHYTVLYWLQKMGFSGLGGLFLALILANITAFFIASFTEDHHKSVSSKILNVITNLRAIVIVR